MYISRESNHTLLAELASKELARSRSILVSFGVLGEELRGLAFYRRSAAW